MKKSYIVEFDSIGDENVGYLISLEGKKNIPFDIRRVYYTYGVPENVERGFHAHINLEQILICINGSVEVKCLDGDKEIKYILEKPNKGLYIKNLVWRELYNYSSDCVLMVLASQYYDEKDYIRNYYEFLEYNIKL